MLSNYKAVFFDVGGTLIEVHPSVGDIYAENARPYGFQGDAGEVQAQFRAQWKTMGGIESLGDKTGITVEKKFWRDLVFRVFEPFGGLRDFDAYFEHIFEVFQRKDSWRVYEDVTDSKIFATLKNRGTILGVISNWDSRLQATLENQGLAQHFDFILASAAVGSAKPDNKIFAEALKRSGVQPHEACHIGDGVHADYQGAKNAGLNAILIDRDNDCEEQIHPKIKSFLELV